jgi:hypothetical protein
MQSSQCNQVNEPHLMTAIDEKQVHATQCIHASEWKKRTQIKLNGNKCMQPNEYNQVDVTD